MIRTAEQYRDGLRDGRRVFYQGKPVPDVTAHPELRIAVGHSALCYDIAEVHPGLAVRKGLDEGPYSAYYHVPRSVEDVADRGALIEAGARLGAGTIVLKEVGSDAVFALLSTLAGEELEKAHAFYRLCRDSDLAIAVAQTDVKGDRSRPPAEQQDADLYLRVVSEDADSITVRGAKCHTSYSANADEIVVLPTRAMGPRDADYAVSFAVPVDTPGLHIYVSPHLDAARTPFQSPVSHQHKMLESLTVFDDVRVPRERVFLARQAGAGPLALAFAAFHRFTAVSYKLALLDLMVGAGQLIAEANGIAHAGHVRDKLARLVIYAETVRGLASQAAARSRPGPHGIQRPDALSANIAKYHFSAGFGDAVRTLIDLSGGLLATGPGPADWANPEIRAVLEKYYAAAVPAERRVKLLNLIADLTVRDFGGYQAVLAVHGEGSPETVKLQISRSYDASRAVGYAAELAGVNAPVPARDLGSDR